MWRIMENFDNAKFGAVETDVVYNIVDGQDLLMDIYFPSSGGPWPVMLFVHGGGWSDGDKAPLAMVPTEAGLLVVSINYRLYPAYRFPAMIEDVKCAIRYLRAHARQYNLDPQRIALVGHSAGAHLSALAGLIDERAGWDTGPYLEQSSAVQAVVVVAGPTDLSLVFPQQAMDLFAGVFAKEQLTDASPVNHAHQEAPPFLIIHGDGDQVVPVEQGIVLHAALKKAGAPVELCVIKNCSHGLEAVGGEMSPSVWELFDSILKFLVKSLGV
jgi:acetyl esterase/lipase